MSLKPFARTDQSELEQDDPDPMDSDQNEQVEPSAAAPGPEVVRHEALLARIAAQVSVYDGSRPGGLLLGPRLLLMAAQKHLSDERLVRLGTAVEMIRRATLVHRDPQRESRWEGYGRTPFSQTLRGDVLLAESFRLLSEDGEPRAVQILSHAMAGVAASELERHTPDADEKGMALNHLGGRGGGTVPEAEGAEEKGMALNLQAAFYEGAAATGALVGRLRPSETKRFLAWARAVGECHELRLAGVTCDPEADDRLRGGPLVGTRTLAGPLLASLGAPDVVRYGVS
jgi:hypothetical protein